MRVRIPLPAPAIRPVSRNPKNRIKCGFSGPRVRRVRSSSCSLHLSRDQFVTNASMKTHPSTPDFDRLHARPKRRRTEILATEREYWRRVFIEEVFARRRIRNLVEQELRPLWKAVDHEVDPGLSWRELGPILDAIRTGELVNPSRQAFLDRRNEIILEIMRCRQQGAPPRWVAAYLYQVVLGGLVDAPLFPSPVGEIPPGAPRPDVDDPIASWPDGEPAPLFEFEGNVLLQAGPYGALVLADGLITTSSESLGPTVHIEFPDPTGRWDDWERFQAEAQGALDQLLSRMRRAYEDRHPEQVNVGADAARHQDARDLAAYLLDGKALGRDRAKHQRLRRFADLLGLDFPVS